MNLKPKHTSPDTGQTDDTLVSTFEGTITDGLLSIAEDGPEEDSLDLIEDGKTGTIRGNIYADGTWQTTAVSWPAVEPDVDLPPMFEFDIEVSNQGPLEGEFDPAGRLTASLALRIDIHVSAVVKSMDVTIAVDAEGLTSETSGELTGEATGLDTDTASVHLVDNDFTVPKTGQEEIDGMFGLPATDPSRNWLELDLELGIETPVERA
jgi:hypothetical protein